MNFLLSLIFFSKVSFKFIPFLPYQLTPFLFQYGLHPYMNILLCTVFGGALIFQRLTGIRRPLFDQIQKYKFILFFLCIYLLTITSLQIILNESDSSVFMQISAALLSTFTIYLFGHYIPTSISSVHFVNFIQKMTSLFCWISLLFLIISPATSFHGGRFIGIFKHIPHMVTTATLCFVFTLHNIFSLNQSRPKNLFSMMTIMCSFFLLILTGTRSALVSVILCFVLGLVLLKNESSLFNRTRSWIKFSLVMSSLLVGIFFNEQITDYSVGVLSGQQSIGYRAAQDGLSSRWEEVERGLNYFKEHQWLGLGLLSKFEESENGEVGSYNANKDPHNLLISAGVIGGWVFIILITISFIGLVGLSLSRLKSNESAIRLLAIYMCSQLPIIFIYHMHLSIGGIADRIYWLVIGFLAITYKSKL